MNSAPLSAATSAPAHRGALGIARRTLAVATEWPAALLLLAELLILFSGAISRYVFHKPLVWADEIASILFLWLVVLGACVALQRGEHMRMTAVVSRLPVRLQCLAQALATALPVAVLASLVYPALEHAASEAMLRTAYLELSLIWRVAAMPVGICLMVLIGAMQLFTQFPRRDVLISLATCALIAIVLWACTPVWQVIGNLSLVVFFVALVLASVLAGVPIAFSFAAATITYVAFASSAPLTVVVSRLDEGMSHVILLSVPLFVLLGALLELTGMARTVINFLASMLAHTRGGLSYVLLGAMFLISGISGSKAADMAAIAPALFPEMKRRGVPDGELGALLSASGAMSETIPPSLVLITVGAITGVSIAALFTGGLVPALLLMLMLAIVVFWQHRKDTHINVQRYSISAIAKLGFVALPAIGLPFFIRAAVVEGVATATEVSTFGIAYCVVVALVLSRSTPWRQVPKMLVDAASLTGAILITIGAATAMAWALTQSGFSHKFAAAFVSLPGGAISFLLLSILLFIILGSFLEGLPAIVLFAPLLFPVARQVGVHEVHYAMVVIVAMGIGLFAPPFGVGYYTACAVGRVDPAAAMKPVITYLVAVFIGLLLIAAFPWLSTGLLPR